MHNRCWFLFSKKLSGNATDAEISELDELLLHNAEWQFAIQQITTIWEAGVDKQASDNDFNKHLIRMQSMGYDTTAFKEADTIVLQPLFSQQKRNRFKPVLIFVCAALIAMAAWLLLPVKEKQPVTSYKTQPGAINSTVVTEAGSRRKMVLPDGTQVWLNAESKLEYDPGYGKTNRNVTLSGEAYFDVVKNAGMPFSIHTNKIHIKVTGTVFNVKAYPGEKISETSLIRGRVEVTVNARPDEKYILKPNEKLVVRDETAVVAGNKPAAQPADKRAPNEPLIQLGYLNYVENDSASVETSWVYNRLIFDNESFFEIARKMERWYGVDITIQDPVVASQQLTYTIKNETVAQALRNMQYASRFRYTINGNAITITK